jgi:hypothetical protein
MRSDGRGDGCSCHRAAIAGLLLFIGALHSSAAAPVSRADGALMRGDYWTMWLRASLHRCPENDIESLGMSDEALDLVDGFVGTLSRQDRERIKNIADYSNRCRQETMGFTCYLAVHVDAFRRRGLLSRFAAFGCENYRCNKDRICNFVGTRR